jgi:catechol 2,3-dioxygenase-like lactoylglutathione lyase family enzyme
MIDHISLAVSDFDKAKKFYSAALAPLGYKVLMEFEGACGLGADGKADLWIGPGEKRVPMHIAFVAKSRKAVDEFHAAALAAGGTDNGPPGLRAQYHPNYYGAFVYDAEGNNIEAVIHTPA